jgi:hypothetical protein
MAEFDGIHQGDIRPLGHPPKLIVNLNLNNTMFVRAPASTRPKVDSSPKKGSNSYLLSQAHYPFPPVRADSTLSSAEMQDERSY